MKTGKKNNYSGIAALFDGIEIKNFFINYLYFIVAVEILIFLISFLGNIGQIQKTFPWKFYFYVSFVTPIAITFLLGIFILAFNQFIFDNYNKNNNENIYFKNNNETKSKLFKINLFLTNIRQIPFLHILFIIIIGTIFLYKLDSIFLFIFNTGERIITYILIASCAILLIAIIFGIIWIFVNYKFNKKQMENEYKYRNDAMNKLGLLIMDNNTVINKDGKMFNDQTYLSYKKKNNIKLEEKKNSIEIFPSI